LNQKNKFQNQSSLKPQLSAVKAINSTPMYLFTFSTFTFYSFPTVLYFRLDVTECAHVYRQQFQLLLQSSSVGVIHTV